MSSAKTRAQPGLLTLVRPICTYTSIGIIAGGLIYDGYYEFQVIGAIGRFLRSLKIAALISLDYSWNLRGLRENTEEYDRVMEIMKLMRRYIYHKHPNKFSAPLFTR